MGIRHIVVEAVAYILRHLRHPSDALFPILFFGDMFVVHQRRVGWGARFGDWLWSGSGFVPFGVGGRLRRQDNPMRDNRYIVARFARDDDPVG